MFQHCTNLISITNFINHGNFSDISNLFNNCTSLVTNNFTTSAANKPQKLNYLYIDVPDESQIEADDRLTLSIEFSNDDEFLTLSSYDLTDCQVFNQVTRNLVNAARRWFKYCF